MFGFFRDFFSHDDRDDATQSTYYEQIPDGHNDWGGAPDYSSGTGMDSWDSATDINFWQDNGF